MKKTTKHDEYFGVVKTFAAYVDEENKTVGIFSTAEDMIKANKSKALKKLTTLFNYHVQMVIK